MIGILGAGMSTLAQLYAMLGYAVAGCDRAAPTRAHTLRGLGIPVTAPPAHLSCGICAVIHTLAVSREDPLLVEAAGRGIPIYTRAEALGEATRAFSRVVAIAGTHGKSTTTAMTAEVLRAGGLSPTVLCGADFAGSRGGFLAGGREVLLLEACEYRDSFLHMRPTTAVVLNCEHDHPDYFASRHAVEASCERFLSLPTVTARITGVPTLSGTRFSIDDGGAALHAEEVTAENGRYSFVPVYRGKRYPRVLLRVCGRHNLQNALAALLIGFTEGVPFASAREALMRFSGVCGRLERRGSFLGAEVYDDYAHHPTEIRAAIAAARELSRGRVIVLFQGHTYSRTRAYYAAFCEALRGADICFVADIYPAREHDTLGLSGEGMARDAGGVYVRDFCDAAEKIRAAAIAGDLVLTLGAGEARRVIPYLLQRSNE